MSDALNKIDDFIRAAASPWLPMSEAPRNGTHVLLQLRDRSFVVGYWKGIYWKEIFDEQILDGLYKPIAFAHVIPLEVNE